MTSTALKGAANYAVGLANNTYQNQFQDLMGVAQGYQNSGSGYNQTGSGLTGVGTGYLNQGQGYNQLASTAISQQAGALSTNQQNYNQLMAPYQTGLQAASA